MAQEPDGKNLSGRSEARSPTLAAARKVRLVNQGWGNATLPEGADDAVAQPQYPAGAENYTTQGRLKKRFYEAELARLQEELVALQYWVQDQGLKVLIIFEGRGSAGKGGVIKRITERTSPRIVKVVARPQPT